MTTLLDFMTPDQVRAAIKIWTNDRTNFHNRILAEIVVPAMPEINRKLKQENVPGYIAYLIEHVFTESQK